ncbi:hypothetical protein AZE42_05056 [Rhizopogon vesiculosus]|uniref:Uncharacterized protein n=1 Tax=Rhizopogon vesiculosus TaxID=180088 RepID=A0A1J8PIR7_9AGAM|nr:hypothetical protein AZE42_05056 [Rhizopogon vesiculosus]
MDRGSCRGHKKHSDETEDAPSKISSSVLPPEFWRDFRVHSRDLFAFGLVAVPKEQPKRLQNDYRFLRAASFLAARVVIVGL